MSVTTPKGFDASGVAAGLKSSGEKMLPLLSITAQNMMRVQFLRLIKLKRLQWFGPKR